MDFRFSLKPSGSNALFLEVIRPAQTDVRFKRHTNHALCWARFRLIWNCLGRLSRVPEGNQEVGAQRHVPIQERPEYPTAHLVDRHPEEAIAQRLCLDELKFAPSLELPGQVIYGSDGVPDQARRLLHWLACDSVASVRLRVGDVERSMREISLHGNHNGAIQRWPNVFLQAGVRINLGQLLRI